MLLSGPIGCGKSVALAAFVAALDSNRYTPLYIDHHTARCGRPTSIFADDAKADIHRHADGVPRLVNALCYRSILHAAASESWATG